MLAKLLTGPVEFIVLLQGAGLVDELTTCWAMISLKRCAELVREMTISVPLYTGSIFEPVSTHHQRACCFLHATHMFA